MPLAKVAVVAPALLDIKIVQINGVPATTLPPASLDFKIVKLAGVPLLTVTVLLAQVLFVSAALPAIPS